MRINIIQYANFRKNFPIEEVELVQTDNPITEPTTRGGVYFAEMKEWKVHATFLDTSVSKHLSDAMLGPNKDFLDIILQTTLKHKKRFLLLQI